MLVSRNFCGEYKRASTSVGGGRSRGGSGSHHDWHPPFAAQSITSRSCRQADAGFASTPSRPTFPHFDGEYASPIDLIEATLKDATLAGDDAR